MPEVNTEAPATMASTVTRDPRIWLDESHAGKTQPMTFRVTGEAYDALRNALAEANADAVKTDADSGRKYVVARGGPINDWLMDVVRQPLTDGLAKLGYDGLVFPVVTAKDAKASEKVVRAKVSAEMTDKVLAAISSNPAFAGITDEMKAQLLATLSEAAAA